MHTVWGGGGGFLRTCKLGFYALSHETELYVVQRPEHIGGHDGLFVLERRNLVGPVVQKQDGSVPPVGLLYG